MMTEAVLSRHVPHIAHVTTGPKRYAGIGARVTPDYILHNMQMIAQCLAARGWTLSSGGARGADRAFEAGAKAKEIYHKSDAETRLDWQHHASRYHPKWSKITPDAKLLHARNSAIVLGPNLNDPVQFVVCWTEDGEASGGTGQALRIAADSKWNIPIFNLRHDASGSELWQWVQNR